MSKVGRLVDSYGRHVAVPWKSDAAAAQRVIFCVYDPDDELRLRARIEEFALVTRQSGHEWAVFDLTDTFAQWLASQKYAKSYFQKPHLLQTLLPKYLDFISAGFASFLKANAVTDESVVALQGVGVLFGFLKVKEVIDRLAPLVRGRLLIFFPGSNEGDNYRLLDGYDGWNYLAVPITADRDF